MVILQVQVRKKLNAYVSSGILSCHEPINFDQVLERLRLGMWIMIREGSIRRDLKEIIPQVLSHGTLHQSINVLFRWIGSSRYYKIWPH